MEPLLILLMSYLCWHRFFYLHGLCTRNWLDCDTATVYITVPNTTVAIDDINNTVVNTPVNGSVLTNDGDVQGDSQLVNPTPVSGPSNGSVVLLPNGNYTYTPNTDFVGEDVFTYEVCDDGSPVACDTATVYINVIGAPTVGNDPPVALQDVTTTEVDVPVGMNLTSNDADPDGDSLIVNTTPISNPSNGSVVINPDGTATYTPNAGFVGVDTFEYSICDADGLCDTTEAIITIIEDLGNTVFANDDAGTGLQDNPITGSMTANDNDPEGDTYFVNSLTPVMNVSNGSVVLNNDGTYVYTPNAGFVGNDMFTYQLCDNGSPQACDTATVYLTVLPAPNTTTAENDINSTPQDTPVNGNVLTNDSDAEGDNQLVNTTPFVAPANGTVVLFPNGNYTYTPNAGFTGDDEFTYIVCDDATPQACDTAVVSITVIGNPTTDNNPPVANDDEATTEVDVPVTSSLLSNDAEPDGDSLIVNTTPISNPSNGGVVINADGTYTYTPNPGFVGVDVFEYEICDPFGLCDQAEVTITILEDAGNATFTQDDAGTGLENNPISGDLLANDTDPEGNVQGVNTTPISNPSNGSVVINPDGTYTYTPNTDFVGNDQFVYSVCDNGSPVACDTATVYLTVLPEPNTTTAEDDINSTPLDTPVNGNVLTNDSDAEGDNQSVNPTPLANPTNGTVVLFPNGNYTYTPNAGYTGDDEFTYIVCDDATPQACDTAVVYITVIGEPTRQNDPPVANNDASTTEVDVPVTSDLLGNDSDPDGDSLVVNTTPISNPSNGGVVINPDGTYTYTPNPGFVGVDVFTYEICDTAGLCDQAEVTITIVDDAGNATFTQDDAGTGLENNPISGDLLANDTDPEGDVQSVNTTPISNPSNGSVVINPDGTYTYTPNTDFVGNDQFVYSVCDNGSPVACDTATVYLTVLPSPELFTAIPNDTTTQEDTPVVIDVLSNEVDVDGIIDPTTVIEVTPPSNGSIVIDPVTGDITYTPNPDFVGTDVFEYAVCAVGFAPYCDTTTVTVTITSQPDTMLVTTPEDEPLTVCTDGETNFANPITSVSLCGAPSNGTASPSVLPCVIYTPDADYNGPDTMCLVTCSGTVCDTTIVIIDVTPVNDPPVAVDDSETTQEDTPVVINVVGNDNDPDGAIDPTTVAEVTPPSNGSIVIDPVTGDITYTPEPDFVGTDVFVYAVCDTGLPVLCDTAVVTVTITSVPDTMLVTTPEDEPLTVCTDGETNFANPITSVSLCGAPSNGTASPSVLPCVIYTPDADYVGPDTMCLVTCSGTVCDTTIVIIDVTPVNDPPVAVDDSETTQEDTPVVINVVGNDNDPDGAIDPTTVAEVTPPSNGSIVIDPVTGDITYTPEPDFVGTDVFVYAVCDTGLPVLCDTAVVTVTITSVPDTMLVTTPEDEPLTVCTDGETNFANPITSVSLCGAPSNGTASPSVLPCVIYTPDADYNGPDTMCLVTCSGTVCDTTIVIIDVTPVNDPPVAVDDSETTQEDTPVVINVVGNDNDPDGAIDPTTVAEVTPPSNGSIVIDPVTGDITYTPEPDFVGTDVFVYAVCDTGLPVLCDTAVVTVTITSVPDTMLVTTPEDEPLTVCTDGETNFANPITSVSLCGAPSNGTASPSVLPCVIYTPDADYNGPDTMCLVTCSGTVCDTTIVIIDVTPVNDPPVAVDDSETTEEDTPVVINVVGNDNDPDGAIDPTTVAEVTPPSNGSITIDPVTGDITYTPEPDFVGTDVFVYAVCDTGLPVLCDTAVVTVTITSVPDTMLVTTPEDEPLTVCTDGETNFANPITSVSLCGAPSNGTASPSVLPCVIYTPDADYNGPDTMCLVTCSGTVCDTTIVIIDVTPVNDPPVAVDDSETTEEDTPVVINVVGNDNDPDGAIDPTTVAEVTPPSNGSIVIDPVTGDITYTPEPDFVGTDVFVYAVCDTGLPVLCDTAVVTVTITSVPDTMLVTTPEDEPLTVCTDGETNFANPITSVSLCGAPSNGTASPSVLPCVIYTPDADYNGPDTMCLVTCSGTVCDTTIVIIDVTPVNDPPVAVDDSETTQEDTPVVINVVGNDNDPDGAIDPTTVAEVTPPSNGSIVIDPVTGDITYTPEPDFVGTDVFVYAVCDTGLPVLCDTAVVTITITSQPDTISVSLPEDSMITVCTTNSVNFANPITSISLCGGPSEGTASPTFLPCLEYVPAPDFYGNDTICVVTCAGTVCDTTIILIEVTPIIDVPVLNPVQNICESQPIPALTGTSEPGSVIQWIENGVIIGTGSPFTPPATPGINCYQAVAFNAGLGLTSPDTAEVCFTIDSLPTSVYAGPDDTICGFQDYELQATGNGLVTFWTQIVGNSVGIASTDPNAIVTLEPLNSPGLNNLYTFVWTNTNGLCTVRDTVSIIVTNPHITSAGNDTTICLPEAGGSVQLNATLTPTATGYWEYAGNGNISFVDSTDAQTVVNGLVPYNNPTSTYRFFWYEIIGDCIARDEVIITVNEAPGLQVAASDTSCLGADYVLDASVTGFSAASYTWRENGPTGSILSWDEDAIVAPVVNTTYYVVASVSFGSNFCSVVDSIEIIIDGLPVATDDGCYDVLEDAVLTGSTNDWSANDDLSAVLTGNVEFEVLSASQLDPASTLVVDNATQTYVYTPFRDMSGVDTALVAVYNVNCPELRDTFVICFNVIAVTDSPIVAVDDTARVTAGGSIGISVLDNDSLNDQAFETVVTVITPPLYGSTDPEIVDGVITYNSETEYASVDSFEYVVCQYLADGEELCDTAWVVVLVDGELYIPEGFTPNGDGINDAFVIPNLNILYPNATMQIFNRWGDEVWNSEGPYLNNWTGVNFGNLQLPDGTYFYIVKLNNGSDRSVASFVVIYR
jgi:gliding motility-associated-like protein